MHGFEKKDFSWGRSFFRTILLGGVWVGGVMMACPAQSQDAGPLDVALYSRNYAKAEELAATQTSAQNLPVFRKWATAGLVPAMWMLANQLYSDGDLQGSANWTYTAVLGSRLDASICTNLKGAPVEAILLRHYWPVVNSARTVPLRMAHAVDFAVGFFRQNNLVTQDVPWICESHPSRLARPWVLPEEQWPERRKTTFEDFVQNAGVPSEQQQPVISIEQAFPGAR
jgi:hypothetical protein